MHGIMGITEWDSWCDIMQTQQSFAQSNNPPIPHLMTHILVAGLWTSDKNKLIRHISEIPLEQVDLVGDLIPAELPNLTMGELSVDSRMTTQIWGAPDYWRHDYVNYLMTIKNILNKRDTNHRVLGMIVVIDSIQTSASADENKLLRLIREDWSLPYIVVASQPDEPYARSIDDIYEAYQIPRNVPILPCDVSDASQANRMLIELMYRSM
jgi:signal recognition particle receptor subunit beta